MLLRRGELPADLDALGSARLRASLPGLAAALDAERVGEVLQRRVLADGFALEACIAGKCLYLGEEGCSLRYDLVVRTAAGAREPLLLLGRVLADDEATAAYAAAVVEGPAVAAADRGGVAAVARLVSVLDGGLVVHPFPIDADLPTLVAAADPAPVVTALRGAGLPIDRCIAAVGHYGRRHRCVLRYEVDGAAAAPATVYGKVSADGRGELLEPTLRALGGRRDGIEVPVFHAYVADLQLSLVSELAGAPALKSALRAGGEAAAGVVADAARVAAALHADGPEVGPVRAMADELQELTGLVALVREVTPTLAATLDDLLGRIATVAAATEPMPLAFSHGDFTPSQLLADATSCGLVDFDGVARAEPALDLGQYAAYLRLAVVKAGGAPADLVAAFLAAYAGGQPSDALRARVLVYECISLFRTTVHAWQKLKPARAEMAFALLCEEAACLSAVTE